MSEILGAIVIVAVIVLLLIAVKKALRRFCRHHYMQNYVTGTSPLQDGNPCSEERLL